MYESPIEMYVRDVTTELCRSVNDQYFVRLSQAVDFDIDREELIKALSYDRFQYERGYRDGLAEHRCKNRVLEQIRAEIKEQYGGCGLVNDGLDRAISIIDKYRAESEEQE